MITKKSKPGCEVVVTSGPPDLNKDDKRFEAAKYVANKQEGFNRALKTALERMGL